MTMTVRLCRIDDWANRPVFDNVKNEGYEMRDEYETVCS